LLLFYLFTITAIILYESKVTNVIIIRDALHLDWKLGFSIVSLRKMNG